MSEKVTQIVQCPRCKHELEVRIGDRIRLCIGDGQEHRTEKELQDILDIRGNKK